MPHIDLTDERNYDGMTSTHRTLREALELAKHSSQCHQRVTELQLCPVTLFKNVQKNQGSGIELLAPGAGLQGDLPARLPQEEAI